MSNGKFISYLRVSTARQGASGLGLDAQRVSIENYLNESNVWTARAVKNVLVRVHGK